MQRSLLDSIALIHRSPPASLRKVVGGTCKNALGKSPHAPSSCLSVQLRLGCSHLLWADLSLTVITCQTKSMMSSLAPALDWRAWPCSEARALNTCPTMHQGKSEQDKPAQCLSAASIPLHVQGDSTRCVVHAVLLCCLFVVVFVCCGELLCGVVVSCDGVRCCEFLCVVCFQTLSFVSLHMAATHYYHCRVHILCVNREHARMKGEVAALLDSSSRSLFRAQ